MYVEGDGNSRETRHTDIGGGRSRRDGGRPANNPAALSRVIVEPRPDFCRRRHALTVDDPKPVTDAPATIGQADDQVAGCSTKSRNSRTHPHITRSSRAEINSAAHQAHIFRRIAIGGTVRNNLVRTHWRGR